MKLKLRAKTNNSLNWLNWLINLQHILRTENSIDWFAVCANNYNTRYLLRRILMLFKDYYWYRILASLHPVEVKYHTV